MSDIIDRLRDDAQGEDLGADGMGWSPDPALKREAADEIERLRAEVAALRAAAGAVIRVWESPSWNWSHTGSAADAMNALSAAIDAARKEPT